MGVIRNGWNADRVSAKETMEAKMEIRIPEPGESRVAYADSLFRGGYNCAQSVFAAYADLFGMDRTTALKMSSAMGGGIGRMREICGAVSAMAMLAGLKEGNDDPENEEAKAHIYALVRDMSGKFKEKEGTLICRELLGIEGMEESAKPTVRTPAFYATRPCARLIAEAAEIIEEILLEREPERKERNCKEGPEQKK